MRSGSRAQSESIAAPSAETLQLGAGPSFFERMGVLYAHRIRLNIVAELHMREMGPKQFFEEVGGSSYESVWRHFAKLLEFGWLRFVRTESRGPGRPEHIYRSNELAIIDEETWVQIPLTIRDSLTVQNLLEMGERYATSLLEAGPDLSVSALSFEPLVVDQHAWEQAIGLLHDCFRGLWQEQTDAKARLAKTGAPPILMIAELAGFEMPQGLGGSSAELPAAAAAHGAPPWPRRISRIFSDPLNMEIINRLNDRAMSPSELHRTPGGLSVKGFDSRCKMLAKHGWVAQVDSQTGGSRRGATEYFYRATSPAVSHVDLFSGLPGDVATKDGWTDFEEFSVAALDAVRAGTFNRRPDRHMTLSMLLVDQLGQTRLVESVRTYSEELIRIGEEARRRLDAGKANGPKRTMGCLAAAFPNPLRKQR
jgi:hypothetical protein